jgi:hypothetical protein
MSSFQTLSAIEHADSLGKICMPLAASSALVMKHRTVKPANKEKMLSVLLPHLYLP